MTSDSRATAIRTASLSRFLQHELQQAARVEIDHPRRTSAPILPGLPHGAIDPARNLATRDSSLPPRVGDGIEALSRLRALVDPHELGDRLGVAGDHDLLLGLQARLGFGPSLTQVADTDRFHRRSISCFTLSDRTTPESPPIPRLL